MNSLSPGALMAMSVPAALGFVRNGIFIAIIANGLIGISLVWDKVLLKKPETRNLVSYVFWLGAISIFGLLLAPFGFHWPRASIAALALCTGILHLAAIWFYYAALKRGEASQTLAVMGGFSPVATALIAIPLLRHPYLARANVLAFALLVGGGLGMTHHKADTTARLAEPLGFVPREHATVGIDGHPLGGGRSDVDPEERGHIWGGGDVVPAGS